DAIVKGGEAQLALTPMVFVMWEERYQKFAQKYGTLSFRTIAQAVQEKGGWKTLAGRDDWGFFKFGHTDPTQSNSGLVTLLLMAYDFHGKSADIGPRDVVNEEFLDFLRPIERRVGRNLPNSTGNMMKEMVLKGPSAWDVILVY